MYDRLVTEAGITDSYEVGVPDMLTLIADGVHRTDHRTADMDARLRKLEAFIDEYRPMLEAYQRGGVLALRQASKTARREANGHAVHQDQ